MQRNLIGAFAFGLLSVALSFQPAHAATFDFVAIAAGNEHGSVSETFTDGGTSVTASARNLANTLTYLAYLDDLSGGDPGGLGVCKHVGASGQCDPDNDDNINNLEVLQLVFNSPVTITSIEFSNASHVDVYTGNFGVNEDGTPTTVGGFTQYLTVPVFTTPLVGTKFSFISNATISGSTADGAQLYISKLTTTNGVPEPMTVGLLGLGVAALAARKTARKRA